MVIGVAAGGAILGDNIGYWVGRSFGRALLLKYGHYIGIGAQKLALGEYLFMRYGGMIVFFGRFVALLRVYAAILAGINRLKSLDFTIYNGAGALVWASMFGLGGYYLGKNLQHFVGPVGWVALATFAVGSYFLWLLFKSHEKRFLADAERSLARSQGVTSAHFARRLIGEWKHNQQQRHIRRKDRRLSDIRSPWPKIVRPAGSQHLQAVW